jgi:serine/threonine-protein kinase
MLLAGRSQGFVLGQYRILDQLGRGGMGRVFKALHQTLDRVVALKVLAPNLLKTERALGLVLREMRAVGRLTHPNIVTAYDANHAEGRYYLVMQYVDGPNLNQLVTERGPLPVPTACDYVRQAALGLQYAADQGMVHRDIKPANLLVQRMAGSPDYPSGQIKILDFGLARLPASAAEPDAGSPGGTILTRQHVIMGTPDYLSPEQARDLHQVDIRSDLYSLGCTFYFLLTGRVPFEGTTSLEKILKHGTDTATPVERLRPEVPEAVATVLRRLMEKDPGKRFQTPAELAEALRPLAGADPAGWVVPDVAGRPYVADPGCSTPQAGPSVTNPDEAEPDADDDSALSGPPPLDLDLNPLSGDQWVSLRVERRVDRDHRRRLKIALGVALAAGLTVLALAGWWLM